MPKTLTQFVCQQCGKTSPRPLGRCPQCGAWGSMVEEILVPPAAVGGRLGDRHGLHAGRSAPVRLDEIEGEVEERLVLPMVEFARVLGGGIVPGSIVLVGGDPGIGKSTLMLQVAIQLAEQQPVLYISGEESERQIKMRAQRLLRSSAKGSAVPASLYLLTETNLEAILEHVRAMNPALLVVDSIQTMTLPELESTAGSVSQVKECASRLRELAKASGVAVFVIGHVTKEGVIA
ncbi:MAG: AAA family ATPase, partial [Chloroflexi bacterium]|nr:AAA family ATPase [Chloroflexota bacterium]